MKTTTDAMIYAAGIYGLSFLVTLLVWVVIVAIRWASGDRIDSNFSRRNPK